MPVCVGCGSSYEDQYQFCPFCGRAKPSKPELAIAKEVTIKEDSELACPRCHKSDKVEKISSIIAHQTNKSQGYIPVSHTYSDSNGHIHTNTYNEGFSSTTTSNLATHLAFRIKPPIEPKKENNIMWYIVIIMVLFYSIGGISTMFSGGSQEEPGMCIISPFFILFCLWMVKRNRRKNETLGSRREEYHRDLERFAMYKKRWSKVFYCYRDDSVFIPGEDGYSSVEALEEFVKKI